MLWVNHTDVTACLPDSTPEPFFDKASRLQLEERVPGCLRAAHMFCFSPHPHAQIPTKVEVFIAPPGADQQQQDSSGAPQFSYKRLGYLSFDSNERSNHQARELKSVHVSVDAVALRLVVHRCHVNKLNIYNQVWLPVQHCQGNAVLAAGACRGNTMCTVWCLCGKHMHAGVHVL